jgi:hypothetical protein
VLASTHTSIHIHIYIYMHTYTCTHIYIYIYTIHIYILMLGFAIYKAYYVSKQKTKKVCIYSLFVREYITRINQMQKLQYSKLLAKIRNTLKCKYVLYIHGYYIFSIFVVFHPKFFQKGTRNKVM